MTIDDSLSIQQAIQQALGFAPPLNRIETSSSYRRFDTEKKNRLNGFFRVSEHKGSLLSFRRLEQRNLSYMDG